VAYKPWRSTEAEQRLIGSLPDAASFDSAAERLLEGAQSQGQNAFKIPLARRAVVRALQAATEGTIDNRGGRRGQPEHAA